MDNIHSKTGIPFGVVNANDLPYLLDTIIQNGTDHNYEGAKAELVARLKACKTVAEVNAVVDDVHYSDVFHVDDMDFDVDELAGNLLEMFECDSAHITYEDGDYKYELLGTYLVIKESPFVATCRPCSPCYPNAGDLNNITDKDGGNVAYCFDPEDYLPDADEADKPKFVIDEETTPPTISLPDEE